MQILLEAGADPTLKNKAALKTALHFAASNGYTAIMQMLLRAMPGPERAEV